MLPAEPIAFPTLGPGVFAKTLAIFVFDGAKWLAPTIFKFPYSIFCKLFTISVLTFAKDL